MSQKNPNSRCARRAKRNFKKSYNVDYPIFKSWKDERKFWTESDSSRRRWFYNKLQ